MNIVITIISIFVITIIVWLTDKVLPFKVCPICAGVSGTWLWMLVGVLTDNLQLTTYNLIMAVLMGGSVVGIAYQFERHILKNKEYQLLWKVLFIPIGFAAAYFAVSLSIIAIPIIIVLGILAFLFWYFPRPKSQISDTAKKLEKEMEQCC